MSLQAPLIVLISSRAESDVPSSVSRADDLSVLSITVSQHRMVGTAAADRRVSPKDRSVIVRAVILDIISRRIFVMFP